MKKYTGLLFVSLLSGAITLGSYKILFENQSTSSAITLAPNYAKNVNLAAETIDFTSAAESTLHNVVHVKNVTVSNVPRNPIMEYFYGYRGNQQQTQIGTGSGVIISEDGFIVTNNHVVNGADEINVTLNNKKTYKAKVIGVDASSDIAVIKIEASGLPYLVYGNSDEIKLGQWVLAIGYPLSLDVTITAGIISAKNRSIDINSRQSDKPVESFLQTDAAVNQGNSGGALVNTSGELIGINSAIASPTGSYAGYSYAIPVNMVKKVVTDIVKYGTVQRAYLGISYPQEILNEEQIKKIESEYKVKIGDVQGIVVTDVLEGGAAKAAGVKVGDIITKINGTAVTSSPELQEQIAKYKPNDKITITLKRDNKDLTLNATLKAKLGNTDLASSKAAEKLGGKLETVDKSTAEKNEIDGGVVVKELGNGILGKSRVEKGFVITHVNDQPVKNTEEFYEALKKLTGATVKLSGIYPGFFGNYAFMLNLNE